MKGRDKMLSAVDAVFDGVKEKGLVFTSNPNKENLADTSNKGYRDTMKHYVKHLFEKHGITDITRAKPRHAYEFFQGMIDSYYAGETSAWTLRHFPHAIHALQDASKKTGVFTGRLKLGDKREMLGLLNELEI